MAAVIAACSSGGGGTPPTVTTSHSSIVSKSASIAPGATCPPGGIAIDIGIDDNGNGTLDTSEVDATQNVCNGLNSLVSIASEPSGTNCANGGFKVTSGADVNGNGTLDGAEVVLTQYACNGANGINGNTAPMANAGPDQKTAAAGTMVTLNGSGSDPDGDAYTYAWSFTARPVGSAASLSSAISSNPTFTPDKAGTYVLSLVVNDGQLNSPADTVAIRAGMPLPDTGQTRWYSTAFGDDGDYTINPMSFTDNGDGTIFDNVTGLTWQKCSMGQSGAECTTGTTATYTWDDAGTACVNLNLAGTGWHLPTRMELLTIVDYGTYYAAINGVYFPGTQSESSYWTSSTCARFGAFKWYVDFSTGSVGAGITLGTYYSVRCVR